MARRVNDAAVLHLLKLILKASGKKGVAQGGVLSPLLSNLYLTEVDQMLERAKEVMRYGQYTYVEYGRLAADLVVLVDAHARHDWLVTALQTAWGGTGENPGRDQYREESAGGPQQRRKLRLLGVCISVDAESAREVAAPIRRSSGSGPHCYASSKRSSAAFNRSPWGG